MRLQPEERTRLTAGVFLMATVIAAIMIAVALPWFAG